MASKAPLRLVEAVAVGCWNCRREPEPGWIETDNNGPSVPCPICQPAKETHHAAHS